MYAVYEYHVCIRTSIRLYTSGGARFTTTYDIMSAHLECVGAHTTMGRIDWDGGRASARAANLQVVGNYSYRLSKKK